MENTNLSFWDIYNLERNNLTQLPDADADFAALEQAYQRCECVGGPT